MRRAAILLAILLGVFGAGPVLAGGPSGSTECHVQDDDCDGRFDEDPIGDVDGDGNLDDDLDGRVDEDPPGDAADDPGENQVDCNEQSSQNAGGLFYLYAGQNGVEACADGSSQLPADGRVFATTDQGGYVAGDGDADNAAPANGYARLDGSGIHCGDESNQDSTADQTSNTAEDCG